MNLRPTLCVAQLGGVDISVPSTVTFTEGDQDPSKRYQGQIDGIMGFSRNLGDEDRRCVFVRLRNQATWGCTHSHATSLSTEARNSDSSRLIGAVRV